MCLEILFGFGAESSLIISGWVYREALELTAYLCKYHGLDPLADRVVICSQERGRF